MKTRNLKHALLNSNRTALIAVLALGLVALAVLPGDSPDANAVAGQASGPATTQVATPAATPAAVPADGRSGKLKFRLLLLRRG